jgi:ribosomal protein L11 methyltransferase
MSLLNVTHELRLQLPAEYKDRFSEFLLGLGYSGFVEGSIDCDISFEYGPEHLHHDYYVDNDKGVSPFVFYSVLQEELQEMLARIYENLANIGLERSQLTAEWKVLQDAEWKESWKDSFRPLAVGDDLVVLPPWEDASAFAGRVAIVIDPGMAFGTGQHETTQLCLSMFLYHTKRRFLRVFDVGTGSGILAIAARKFGCDGLILGCDIDPDSVRIAAENAVLNGCPEIKFTNDAVAHIDEKNFDLVFANITAKPLLSLIPAIVERAAVGAEVLISGVLDSEEQDFTDVLRKNGLNVRFRTRQRDWVGLIATRS